MGSKVLSKALKTRVNGAKAFFDKSNPCDFFNYDEVDGFEAKYMAEELKYSKNTMFS